MYDDEYDDRYEEQDVHFFERNEETNPYQYMDNRFEGYELVSDPSESSSDEEGQMNGRPQGSTIKGQGKTKSEQSQNMNGRTESKRKTGNERKGGNQKHTGNGQKYAGNVQNNSGNVQNNGGKSEGNSRENHFSEDRAKLEGARPKSGYNRPLDFCEDPAVVRARREAHYRHSGKTSDVVGKPKGQGQDEKVLHNREKKNINKSSRANHNRKGGAQWKRNKGMLPS